MSFSFDEAFEAAPIILILRGMSTEDSVATAVATWNIGIRAVEIPLQGERGHRALLAVIDAGRAEDRTVGAGTITTAEQVDVAVSSGAAFTVAPGFDHAISEHSENRGIPHLPDVATATDVKFALAAGRRWLKAFPASVLGEDWFRAMRGPFPDVRIVATGGISPAKLSAHLDAGADAVALGSAVSSPAVVASLRTSLAGRLKGPVV